MIFKIHTENCLTVEANSLINDLLSNDIIQLIPNITQQNNAYIVLEPDQSIDNSIYLQILFNEDKTFILETRVTSGDSWKHYRFISNDKNETLSIVKNYFIYNEAPDLKMWKDITYEILNRKNYGNIDKESIENINKLFENTDAFIKSDLHNYFNKCLLEKKEHLFQNGNFI
jgi:hypothetical protein